MADDLSRYKTADALWTHIQDMAQGPATPPADAESLAALIQRAVHAVSEFQSRYPKDPRRWEAKLMGIQLDSDLASVHGEQPDASKIESELKEVAGAPDASQEARSNARFSLIQMHIEASGQDTLTPDLEKEMLAYLHDFPDDPDDAQLQSMRLESLQKSDPATASKMLDALLKDPNPAVVAMAQAQVRMRDLMKKPLELQFTAVDGSKVDVSKLRGKVVLIDFWATWCGPCMQRVPDTVDAYNALHGKGFEVVGISLDQDKAKLEAVTKSSGMTWPQYFDGKGWDNAISASYGITSIPRMWLVNKKGMVVDTDVEDGLQEKVEKLLGE